MRPPRARLWLLLVAFTVLVPVQASAAPQSFGVAASALVQPVSMASDRGVVGRGDILTFTVWLNITGSGQIPKSWVNLTFDTAVDPSQNSLAQGPLGWTAPNACVTRVASGWLLQWQCLNLNPGTYVWTIPANVPGNATVGHFQRAMVSAVSQTGTGTSASAANRSVWIAGAIVRITDIVSSPSQSARTGDIVQYWINATNAAPFNKSRDPPGTGTAFNVSLEILLDPGLRAGRGLTSLEMDFPSLPPDSNLSVNLEAIVASNLTAGTVVGIHVRINYRDFNGHAIGPIEGGSPPLYVVQASVLSRENLVAGAAIGLVAILASLVVLLYMGQRKIVIDEVFLMHKNGVLLRRAGRQPAPRKDDDLVASMFVAIQEFVRDSFRKEAALDGVSFGGRRAAVVRGELTILAAVISRGDIEYVIPEMLAAVRAIEMAYWDTLVNWDGSMSSLEGADALLERFLRGQFRSPWRVQLT